MNKQIRTVGVISALLVFALLANLTYTSLVRQPALEVMDSNIRARLADFDVQRGQILAGDTVIADTVASSDDSAFRHQRVYPNGELYAPITGYLSFVFTTARLESSFNSYLVGSSSEQWLQNLIDTMSGRTPQGADVVTTVRPELQQAAWDALEGYAGAIIALDPHSGAVLAQVSRPSYDPNLLASHDSAAQMAAWDQLTADPANPMLDKTTRDAFPPGSTFKLVVAATALEHGYTPETMVPTPASVQLPNSTSVLPNSSNCGNTEVTLTRALALSCNTAFAKLGVALGADAVAEQAERFGFNATHLPELSAIASQFPAIPDDAAMMLSSIGQMSVTATPLQMAMVAAAFVNGGAMPDPYIVEQVRAPDLSVIYQHQTHTTPVVSQSTAQAMQDMMVQVVESGTGTAAAIPGVSIGGKSGTSETSPDNPTYAWFVAFGRDPDIVVSVFLKRDDTSPANLWGGENAAPVARAVTEASR
jgi:cell division protein FtsI/penicillin-binding protein 2